MNTLLKHLQILILLPLAFTPFSLGHCQDLSSGQTPAPTPPYVGALPADFSLAKKFTHLDAHLPPAQQAGQDFLSPPSTKTKELDAVQKGDVRKDTQIFLDGSGREIWRWKSYRFTVYLAHPDSVSIDVAPNTNNSAAQDQYHDPSDFPELSWVEKGEYAGIQTRQGEKCYTFKSGDQTAWIDVSTRLPVYLESKTLQVSYTYSAPPDEPLQLPKGFAEKLQKYKRAWGG